MIELFQESMRLVNLPFTLLAGVAVLYWAMVVFGMADLDVVDMDFDFDTDIDVDADAEELLVSVMESQLTTIYSTCGLV